MINNSRVTNEEKQVDYATLKLFVEQLLTLNGPLAKYDIYHQTIIYVKISAFWRPAFDKAGRGWLYSKAPCMIPRVISSVTI